MSKNYLNYKEVLEAAEEKMYNEEHWQKQLEIEQQWQEYIAEENANRPKIIIGKPIIRYKNRKFKYGRVTDGTKQPLPF